MRYLGIEPRRPRVAVFDFTGCEGCELQLANKEETLAEFLGAIEVVNFREISSHTGGPYEVALVDGAVTRSDEVERLKQIRKQARMVVALGTCACFGGVSRLKNAYDLKAANREVYGDKPKETRPTRPIKDVIQVDMEVPGCPVSKDEVERIVQHLIWDVPHHFPAYPVCLECKQRYAICRFEMGELCLGPITRAGCGAPCPGNGLGCWGCRGISEDANFESFMQIARERGFSERQIRERLEFFGGFEAVT
jgi:coenzyme F420-reducing hydrogenase gamma subunit